VTGDVREYFGAVWSFIGHHMEEPMNTLSITLTGISIVAAVSVVGAQSGKNMDHAPMGETMKTTYTGCVETVNHGAAFVLTHIADDHMGMMRSDMAMPEPMKMNDDAMMKQAGPSDMHETGMHPMAPTAMLLAGSPNVRKHVGQKVEVTGSLSKAPENRMPQDLETLNVSSLKVVAKTCVQNAGGGN
jgi:hypothetical protein